MSHPEFTPTSSDRDPRLWQIAQSRASFKSNLVMYMLVNAILIGVWYFTGRDYFWPIWPLLGWGLGLAIHAYRAYAWDGTDLVEQEYKNSKTNEERRAFSIVTTQTSHKKIVLQNDYSNILCH